MIRTLLVGLTHLLSGARARWVGSEPVLRQRVYFANHTSHLDYLVIWAALPRALRATVRPVGSRAYWERGRVRNYLAASVFNTVLIDRWKDSPQPGAGERFHAAKNTLEQLLGALKNGASLIIFPEGTRGRGAEIGPFQSGLFYIALKNPDVELVPVYLENLNRILPKGEVLPVPLMGSVTFGPPVRLQTGEFKAAFLERARKAILDMRAT